MPRERLLPPVRPNVALEQRYQRQLEDLVEAMHRSLMRYVIAAYRKHEPATVAQDESATVSLVRAVRRLSRRWQKNFNEAAPALGDYFATAMGQRTDAALHSILKRGGFAVRFRKTRAVNDALQATVHENVSLIKSIAQQHLGQVEQAVMRSVQAGRDLQSLNAVLEQQFKVTQRRARLIAKDQNNKATNAIQSIRQQELGLTHAVWVHSGGGKHPRHSHLKAGKDKVKFDVKTGWYDPDEGKHILPGELINCRCVSRVVVPGLS